MLFIWIGTPSQHFFFKGINGNDAMLLSIYIAPISHVKANSLVGQRPIKTCKHPFEQYVAHCASLVYVVTWTKGFQQLCHLPFGHWQCIL